MNKFYNIDGNPSDEKTAKSIVLEWNDQFKIFAKVPCC